MNSRIRCALPKHLAPLLLHSAGGVWVTLAMESGGVGTCANDDGSCRQSCPGCPRERPPLCRLGRGPVISIKFSLDQQILAVQRTSRTIVRLAPLCGDRPPKGPWVPPLPGLVAAAIRFVHTDQDQGRIERFPLRHVHPRQVFVNRGPRLDHSEYSQSCKVRALPKSATKLSSGGKTMDTGAGVERVDRIVHTACPPSNGAVRLAATGSFAGTAVHSTRTRTAESPGRSLACCAPQAVRCAWTPPSS